MKLSQLLFAVVLFVFPLFMNAQDHIGTWMTSITNPDGNTMTLHLTFNADNTYGVDFFVNGTAEEIGKYSVSNGALTMTASNEGGGCMDKKGVYKLTADAKTLTMALVSDECEVRKGSMNAGDSFKFTRVK
ncbi:MAG: hypothetical protein AAFO07_29150 [Bacteroidota bacterium]